MAVIGKVVARFGSVVGRRTTTTQQVSLPLSTLRFLHKLSSTQTPKRPDLAELFASIDSPCALRALLLAHSHPPIHFDRLRLQPNLTTRT